LYNSWDCPFKMSKHRYGVFIINSSMDDLNSPGWPSADLQNRSRHLRQPWTRIVRSISTQQIQRQSQSDHKKACTSLWTWFPNKVRSNSDCTYLNRSFIWDVCDDLVTYWAAEVDRGFRYDLALHPSPLPMMKELKGRGRVRSDLRQAMIYRSSKYTRYTWGKGGMILISVVFTQPPP